MSFVLDQTKFRENK